MTTMTIENLEDKIKFWEEIETIIWDIFFEFNKIYTDKYPRNYIEFDYANIKDRILKIEYCEWEDGFDTPSICYIEIPIEFMTDINKAKEYLKKKYD